MKGDRKTEGVTKKAGKWAELIFYSNFFYGICAIALTIEAALQQKTALNGLIYYLIFFLATILYYSFPYIRKSPFGANPRTNWYSRNHWWLRPGQIIISILLAASFLAFLVKFHEAISGMSFLQWLLVFIFPVVAFLYYGVHFLPGNFNLRKTGWPKPFIIGFIWAGLVTVYPVMFYDIINKLDYNPGWAEGLLFLKNFMFVSILCIMFDIKDYATDYTSRLKTFVVNIGLRKTIYQILLPLSFTGLLSFICYGMLHHFQAFRILLNNVPFVLLILTIRSLRKRRSLLYYLSVVDGLMLIKAACGSIAILYF